MPVFRRMKKKISKKRAPCAKSWIFPIASLTVPNNIKSSFWTILSRNISPGRTPNPCVICNAAIKFAALPLSAAEQGLVFDKFATGHYARLSYNEKLQRYQLRRAVDEKKDQSYFLYRLQQEQLAKIMLPLGEFYQKRGAGDCP